MFKKLLALMTSALVLVSAAPSVLAADKPVAIASNGSVELAITPDKTKVEVGEEITFTISMTSTDIVNSIQFELNIGSGLEYVEKSADINAGNAEELLDYAGAGYYRFTEASKVFLAYGDSVNANQKTGEKIVLMTFKCKAVEAGNSSYDLNDIEIADNNFETLDVSRAAHAQIEITPKKVPVTGVTVTPSSATLKAKGETVAITATVAPADATNKNVTFKSSDEKVATVDANGVVTAVANGTATITVTTADGGYTATVRITVDIPHKHTMVKVEAKGATCTEEGNNEYYKCSECGKVFKDAEGKTETTVEAEVIAKTPHSPIEVVDEKYLASAANCTSPAKYYKVCAICGEILDETFESGEVDATNHANTELRGKVDATEEAAGYTGDLYCKDCDTLLEEGEEIPQLVHMADVTKVEAKEPTETEDGNIEYYICNNCGKYYKDAEGKEEITLADTVLKATGPSNSSSSSTPSGSSSSTTSDADKNPVTGAGAGTAALATGVLALGAIVALKKRK